MARACGWCGIWDCTFQDIHEGRDSPVVRYKPILAPEKRDVDNLDLFLDSEYRRLVAVRDAAERKWHQSVIVRHRAYQAETAAAGEKKNAAENLEKYIRAKQFDKIG